jgi:AcrR family transcriptional regulator
MRRTAEQIVDAIAGAAHALLLERSPSAVSLREIAAEAQVNLGFIHRYVGSKDDVVALVLDRHTQRARAAAAGSESDEVLLGQIAETVVKHPATGRLLAGLILDGVDVSALKGEFPLLDRMAEPGHEVDAAMTYALALGWEVFGPSLVEAVDVDPEPGELVASLSRAMRRVQG